jgi:hypothetical protein
MAFYHTPALCMPSTGWQTIGEPESIEHKVDGNPVSFVRYALQQDNERVSALQFLSRGRRIGSFFCRLGHREGALGSGGPTLARSAGSGE